MSSRNIGVLPSAARTATNNSELLDSDGCKYLDLVIDITTFSAGSLTVTVQGHDPISGKYYTVLASAALAAAATTVLRVGPALTAAANTVANFAMPKKFRVLLTHADATSITYSIGASLQ